MKLILTILGFVTITSCNCQNNKMNDTEKVYKYWKESSMKSITESKELLDYQKENLTELIQVVTLSNFEELKKLFPSDKTNNEYYLLEFSEGEVVTAYLYYIIESCNQYKLAFINIYEGNKDALVLKKSNSDIKKLIQLKPIVDNSLGDELFILTTMNKEDISSVVGNKEW